MFHSGAGTRTLGPELTGVGRYYPPRCIRLLVDALVAAVALTTYDKAVETIARTFDVLSIKRM
jgi:hypothetical protein